MNPRNPAPARGSVVEFVDADGNCHTALVIRTTGFYGPDVADLVYVPSGALGPQVEWSVIEQGDLNIGSTSGCAVSRRCWRYQTPTQPACPAPLSQAFVQGNRAS